MALIRQRQVVPDNWQLLKPAADGSIAIPSDGDVIVPLAVWRAQRDALSSRAGRVGVWLNGNDDPALIAADLEHFQVVAINFPQFTDGRGYSSGRLLRERYGWRGELRAIGDILRDQLFYLARCGFDAFVLREGEDAHAALASFNDFSEGYQSSVERPQPLFRRRASNAAQVAVGSVKP
jgi:uncharacterized protein (DUF934 family)